MSSTKQQDTTTEGKTTTSTPLTSEEGIISREELLALVHQYEEKFGMTSEEFLKRWEADAIPDTFETNDWAMILDAL